MAWCRLASGGRKSWASIASINSTQCCYSFLASKHRGGDDVLWSAIGLVAISLWCNIGDSYTAGWEMQNRCGTGESSTVWQALLCALGAVLPRGVRAIQGSYSNVPSLPWMDSMPRERSLRGVLQSMLYLPHCPLQLHFWCRIGHRMGKAGEDWKMEWPCAFERACHQNGISLLMSTLLIVRRVLWPDVNCWQSYVFIAYIKKIVASKSW